MMNLKMKNKTLFLCLPAILNVPFGGSSVFGANPEKDNKENSPKRPKFRLRIWIGLSIRVCHSPKLT